MIVAWDLPTDVTRDKMKKVRPRWTKMMQVKKGESSPRGDEGMSAPAGCGRMN